MALLQEVAVSTAAAVCPGAVFTQLVTDPPDFTVVVVWAIIQSQYLDNRHFGKERVKASTFGTLKLAHVKGLHKHAALTDTGAAVIGHSETIGAIASASLGRRVAEELAAQGGALLQACEGESCKLGLSIDRPTIFY